MGQAIGSLMVSTPKSKGRQSQISQSRTGPMKRGSVFMVKPKANSSFQATPTPAQNKFVMPRGSKVYGNYEDKPNMLGKIYKNHEFKSDIRCQNCRTLYDDFDTVEPIADTANKAVPLLVGKQNETTTDTVKTLSSLLFSPQVYEYLMKTRFNQDSINQLLAGNEGYTY
jgi:hypothetical protein